MAPPVGNPSNRCQREQDAGSFSTSTITIHERDNAIVYHAMNAAYESMG